MQGPLTPEMLLQAYANGYFPMAMTHDDPELFWFSPEERGVIPLDKFHIPRGLRKALKSRPYKVTVDRDFANVIRGCAQLGKGDRDETWINESIIEIYTDLHKMGHAHSVEVWMEHDEAVQHARSADGPREPEPKANEGERSGGGTPPVAKPPLKLIGGLYGVTIGGAFFGESMFSLAPDASKFALVALVEILNEAGYELLDTQYVNEHLKQFGVEAVPKQAYMIKLEKALRASPSPSSRFSTASVRKGFASESSASIT